MNGKGNEHNMKIGVMQPYFVPYIGYWQRIKAVDKHVIYDDVNYIKGGWINRNRILLNGEPRYINAPMSGASPNKLINEVGIQNNPVLQGKTLRTLEQAYRRAPHYDEAMGVLEPIIRLPETSLSNYLIYQIKAICAYLGIKTELVVSSQIEKDNSLRAQSKVVEICKILGADEYYNAKSGSHLYDKGEFAKHDIKLSFIEADPIEYHQFHNDFIPSLSVIDVMMFNSVDEIQALLLQYSLS